MFDGDNGVTDQLLPPPYEGQNHSEYISSLRLFRESCLRASGYTESKGDGLYSRPELKWTQDAYMQPQSHMYDRFLFDPVEQKFTPERFLEDLNERYGGIDSVLLWPTYTNIGIDDRNQFDWVITVPGGVDALSELVADLKAADVQVLFPYSPWDTGTRYGGTDEEQMAELLASTGADGFNADTMAAVTFSFVNASLQADGRYPVIEPESSGVGGENPDFRYTTFAWDTMSWGYFSDGGYSGDYPLVPFVDKMHFVEPRHMTNICNRWAKNHTGDLQMAWFNGVGFETWENVWGAWNELVAFDAEAVRRVGTMLRFFGGQERRIFQSLGWEPHKPTVQENIFMSFWPSPSADEYLFTLVNRDGRNTTGTQLLLDPADFAKEIDEYSWFDCTHGTKLEVVDNSLAFDLEAEDYGCVFATSNGDDDEDLLTFLETMKGLTEKSLWSYMKEWTYLQQERVPAAKALTATSKSTTAKDNMVRITPEAGWFFESFGVEIEGGENTPDGTDDHGTDIQFESEDHPSLYHGFEVDLEEFYIDMWPVTVEEYSQYLKESGYLGGFDGFGWLSGDSWDRTAEALRSHQPVTVTPKVKGGAGERPVVGVSLQEARDYCSWQGKRLPEVEEWQYVAQGGQSGVQFPWGKVKEEGLGLYPSDIKSDSTVPPRASVHQFDEVWDAAGLSFGVKDLIGNVWQYTSEFQDIHTRAVIMKGSANYYPSGSQWYFPQALRLDSHNKYFLMGDAYERASTVGFRCVADVEGRIEVVEG
ncbi:hypothetical protein TrVE_jg8931 [Triparma verrucosa]|uniref:Sulfatase-modifying factor enzyme-like domain-containing protein n=1 Tax=Triparma verrucosa TaxID=1606542 RepID=A0A9W7EW93_9STRA|nr:hypothetical protein TrVE_jg8931 [Triparma verrucosa]